MGSKRRVHLPIITVDRVQEAALVESIAHWVRMRDGGSGMYEGISHDDCACCVRWIANLECRGCPIAEFATVEGCKCTPYSVAYWASKNHGLDSPEFRAAAAKEVTFLEGVLRWVREGKPAR